MQGPASKISRRHAVIKLKHSTEFHLANEVPVLVSYFNTASGVIWIIFQHIFVTLLRRNNFFILFFCFIIRPPSLLVIYIGTFTGSTHCCGSAFTSHRYTDPPHLKKTPVKSTNEKNPYTTEGVP